MSSRPCTLAFDADNATEAIYSASGVKVLDTTETDGYLEPADFLKKQCPLVRVRQAIPAHPALWKDRYELHWPEHLDEAWLVPWMEEYS